MTQDEKRDFMLIAADLKRRAETAMQSERAVVEIQAAELLLMLKHVSALAEHVYGVRR